MDGPRDDGAKVNATEKDKYYLIIYMWGVYADKYHVIIYMWIFKYGICTVTQMNVICETGRESQSHRRGLWLPKKEVGGGGGMDGEFGVIRGKLLYPE